MTDREILLTTLRPQSPIRATQPRSKLLPALPDQSMVVNLNTVTGERTTVTSFSKRRQQTQLRFVTDSEKPWNCLNFVRPRTSWTTDLWCIKLHICFKPGQNRNKMHLIECIYSTYFDMMLKCLGEDIFYILFSNDALNWFKKNDRMTFIMLEKIYISNKCFSFEFFIHYSILKKRSTIFTKIFSIIRYVYYIYFWRIMQHWKLE